MNPTNREDVWFPQVPMLHSIDGGKTLQYVKGLHHGDHHDLWIDPKNPKRMIAANDGGVDISTNGGETWFAPPLPISQFYHVSADTRVPYHVAGAMQDLGTAQGPSESLRGNIALSDWHDVGGGEAGHVVSDASDPNIVYAGEYLGIITRYDHRTGESRNVSAWPENPSGHGGEDMKYRFQWTAPIAASPHDPKVIYHGAQVIFRTTNGGQSWDVISPDLTRNDKSKQKWSGGPITGDNTGVETYDTIFAIAESPMQKGLIWAGSDDGLVHVTRDGGKTWTNVTGSMPGLPEWGTVNAHRAVSVRSVDRLRRRRRPSARQHAAVSLQDDRLRANVEAARRQIAAGSSTCTRCGRIRRRRDSSISAPSAASCFRPTPAKRGGTSNSICRRSPFTTSSSKMTTWSSATHGRSMWILDDLRPIRDFDKEIASSNVHVFPVADAIRWRLGSDAYGSRAASFPNPPSGASISYFLKEKPKGELRIEILDARGSVVRTLSSVPREPDGSSDHEDPEDLKKAALEVEPGIHRTSWDLAWQGATTIKGGKIDTGDPQKGPRAIPGPYTVRLSVDGKTETTPLRVLPDPRGDGSQAELEAQLTNALRVRDDVSRLTSLVNNLRSVKEQLRARAKALEPRKSEPGVADLLKSSDDIIRKADALEDKLHNPTAEVVYDILAMRGGTRLYSRLAPLQMWTMEAEGPPTAGMLQVLQAQEKELSDLETETRNFVEEEVGTLNAAATRLGLSFVIVK